MLLSSRGYLGEIESDKTKPYNFSRTFFLRVSCGVGGSASNFQVLIRIVGGGRAF